MHGITAFDGLPECSMYYLASKRSIDDNESQGIYVSKASICVTRGCAGAECGVGARLFPFSTSRDPANSMNLAKGLPR